MTEKTAKKSRLYQTEDRWTEANDLAFQIMWFEFLKVSPSYELARRHRAGELSEQDRLPSDFEAVLAVFDDLGDVRGIEFETWWKERGLEFLGNEGVRLTVFPIGVLSEEYADPLNVVANRVSEFIEGRWSQQGKPTTAIMSIPLGLTKSQILDHVGFLLSAYEDDVKEKPRPAAKYPVKEGKKDLNSLFGYMKCLVVRSQIPEAKLHEVGAIAEISSTYSARVGENESAEDRENLRTLTHRALERGLMIAENAARGIFPSHEKNEHAVPPEQAYALIDSVLE
ncbi:hypothetical protein [Novosphingobium sp. TCA1]|jgi:hypothetical protein|uniref:hypothetical protein n=1 Tax=Novosphingobium sp. TCA1 TaxID=2682474 RepID=UPI0013068FA1|nr:hypothetical protein [Novosphingobium sp. TCA1]GFE76495.1 hypothetical protein NTCA1_41440 [Novosphingobium sp. TCA1]